MSEPSLALHEERPKEAASCPTGTPTSIEEFRANGGAVASFADQPLLLLTHRGAKTGTERTNPVAYFRDGEDYAIVASKGGAPSEPRLVLQPPGEPRCHGGGGHRVRSP